MIFTKPKPLDEVLKLLGASQKLLILGCGTCSADCHTGGEKEVETMKKRLESLGKEVVEGAVVEALCNIEKVKRALKSKRGGIEEADALLVMSCGIAVQVVAGFVDKPVLPALDTVFAGALERIGHYHEMCSLCGDCVVGEYGGLCPVNRCPKGMLNGPCGGPRDGRCEVDADLECVWIAIYERLKALGAEGTLQNVARAKDHARWTHPRKVEKGLAVLKGEW